MITHFLSIISISITHVFQEPDEFLQRLNFGAAADIKENKPLSKKDKGWHKLINFFCHFVFDPFSGMLVQF